MTTVSSGSPSSVASLKEKERRIRALIHTEFRHFGCSRRSRRVEVERATKEAAANIVEYLLRVDGSDRA